MVRPFEYFETFLELGDDALALGPVDGDGRLENMRFEVILALGRHQGTEILAEARPSPASPRLKEAVPDARIQADAPGDLEYVGTHLLAEAGHLVDERDLGGEEGVGGVLDELGRLQVGRHERHPGHLIRTWQEGRGVKVCSRMGAYISRSVAIARGSVDPRTIRSA